MGGWWGWARARCSWAGDKGEAQGRVQGGGRGEALEEDNSKAVMAKE